MLRAILAGFIGLTSAMPAYAISKAEFMKMDYKGRQKFAVVVGMSPDYAIPHEEFMKLSFEVRSALAFEIAREMVQYYIQNIGKREGELDASRLYNLAMIDGESYQKRDKDIVIDYGTVCGIYRSRCENHFKALPYCWKDYYEWKKYEQGQPAIWKHPGGDEHPLSSILNFFGEYDMYKEWDALYADYSEFWWKGYAASECKQLTSPGPDCVSDWLKRSEGYQGFLKEWEEIKRKSKATKPKPLSIQVRIHEDFYSGNVKKVFGALEYYRKNEVKFMIKKAARHKNPVIAKKAQEYLDNWDKPVVEDKKETQTAPREK